MMLSKMGRSNSDILEGNINNKLVKTINNLSFNALSDNNFRNLKKTNSIVIMGDRNIKINIIHNNANCAIG